MSSVRGDCSFRLEESFMGMKALHPCCPSPRMPSERSLLMLSEVWNIRRKPRKIERQIQCSCWLISSPVVRISLWLCLRWFKEFLCVCGLDSRDSQGSRKCSPVLSVSHHQPCIVTDQAMNLISRLDLIYFSPLRLQIMKSWILSLLKN